MKRMYRRAGRILLGVLLLGLAGPVVADVSEGMSRDQVIEAWGDPRAVVQSDGLEILFYDRNREVALEDGAVVAVVSQTPSRFTRPALLESADPRIAETLESVDWDAFSQQMESVDWDGLMHSMEIFEIEWEELGLPAWTPYAALGLSVAVMLFYIIVLWIVYEKAGEAGWASLIPIYNVLVYLRMASMSMWYFLLLLIPLVNFVVSIIMIMRLSRNFGHGVLFGFGLLLLPFLFYPILAFGESEFEPE